MTQFALLNPDSINVNREQRQRSDILDTSEIEESIARLGVLQPIVVRRDWSSGEVWLIAGERRLKACLALNRTEIPAVYIDDLSPVELKLIELEENIKRKDISWKDQVNAIVEIHNLHLASNSSWTSADTARSIGIESWHVWATLRVAKYMQDSRIANATTLFQANSIIARISERRATETIAELFSDVEQMFRNDEEKQEEKQPNNPWPKENLLNLGISQLPKDYTVEVDVGKAPKASKAPSQESSQESGPVLCTDFQLWAEAYTGPKFNLIHCDFPYGMRLNHVHAFVEPEPYDNDPEMYWNLLYTLCKHIEKFASYSANMIFWFSMNYYCDTVKYLRSAGFHVRNHPLIWYHSDNRGMTPDKGLEPRRVYDTALLCTRGSRPLLAQIANCVAAPVAFKPKIHPTQKSEPMLREFFRGLVDETTTFLDPTCGSGSALIAAEDNGARLVLGLDLNPDFVSAANGNIRRARLLRRASRKGA